MPGKKLNILIADDEEGLRCSMAAILELEGHHVETACDGEEAVEKTRKNSFDIAFLDIKMPGISGVETLLEIKKTHPETVIVLMTAYAMNDILREALRVGAYACINKPFDMDTVIATIQEVANKPFALVINDDPVLCDQLQERLKEGGYTVAISPCNQSGLALAQQKLPDVVLIDIVMDKMNGIETIKKMKKLLGNKCPKIIAISGHEVPEEFDEAIELGAVECLQKPLDLSHLGDVIDKSKGKKSRICIVDDDKLLCTSLKEVLDSNGYSVDVAYSGTEMIEKIKKESFHALILDTRLPDVNGIEVFEKIKKINSSMGVIFISGYASDEYERFLQKNNCGYLYKPFEPEALIAMIESIGKDKENETRPPGNADGA